MNDSCENFRQNPAGSGFLHSSKSYQHLVQECGAPYDMPRSQQIISKLSDRSEVPNPNLTNMTCELVNTKKYSKYIFRYDPGPMLSKLRAMGFTEDKLQLFDQTPRDGCCNVVSIALYLKIDTQQDVVNVYSKYLPTIVRTIQNVATNLPNWIVRLYLDTSVYDLFDTEIIAQLPPGNPKYRDDAAYTPEILMLAQQTIEFMLNADNVEIYTYACPNLQDNIAQVRSYRFLPLSDPEVNICAVREADGIVTNLECYNLKLFAEEVPGRLFYLPMVVPSYKTYKFYVWEAKDGLLKYQIYGNNSYSEWLNKYRYTFMEDYFKDHVLLYDLLAGTFTCKLRLRRETYLDNAMKVNSDFAYYDETILPNQIAKYETEGFAKAGFYSLREAIQTAETSRNYLFTGYDEIVLLRTYLDFTSQPYGQPIEFYDDYVETLFYVDNLPIIDLTASTDLEDILDVFAATNLNINRDLARQYYDCFMAQKPQFRQILEIEINYQHNAYLAYFIDTLLKLTSTPQLLNIKFKGVIQERWGYTIQEVPADYLLSQYINVPYNPRFNICYDT